MPPPLLDRLRDDIERRRLFTAGDTVIVALSGGPDSVALLCLLHELREELGIELRGAHCNHGLRGAESDGDEDLARQLCLRLAIDLDVERVPGPPAGGNLEEQLREQRYEFLARVAARHDALIATGHTRDDLVETLLLNLFRGAGPTGLASIPWMRPLGSNTVIRPLLGCRRAELIEELERRGQDWRYDSSNADTGLDRNWIRHELVPQVEKRLNPNLAGALAGTAELMAELDRWTSGEVEKLGIEDPARIPIEILLDAPLMLRRAAVRDCIRSVRGDLRGLELQHIDAALELAAKQTGRRLDLPGLRAEREFDALVLYHPSEGVEPFSVPLQVPGTTALPGLGKSVRIGIHRTANDERRTTNDERRTTTSTTFSPPPGPLIARNRLPKDRYRIEGRPEKSVKRLLSESRVPRRQRDRLVCIASGDALLWIEGFPPNANYQSGQPERLSVTVEEQRTADSEQRTTNDERRTTKGRGGQRKAGGG